MNNRIFETWVWFIMCAMFVAGLWMAPSVISHAHNDTAIIGCDRGVMDGIEGRLRRIEEGMVLIERRLVR